MNRRRASIAIALAAALGCGAQSKSPAANDPACSAPAKCPNDPPPTSDQVDACTRTLAGPCGPSYRALLDCAAHGLQCDAAGRTDPAAIAAACSDEQSAYDQCFAGPPDGAFAGHD